MSLNIEKINTQLSLIRNGSNSDKLCKKIADNLAKYCSGEINLLEAYRLLRRARYSAQLNKDNFPGFTSQYNFLIHIIDTEIEIIMLKIKEPELRMRIPKLLKWTDTLTALTEIIEGIQNLSINHGKGKLEEITACFEFIFQVKLGNISDKFADIRMRKSNKLYIDRVRDNLLKKIQK